MSRQKKLGLYNCAVITMDDSNPFAEAILIGGEKILGVGKKDDIKHIFDKNTEKIDLEGRCVIPGFIDSHCHFLSLGAINCELNLTDTNSLEDVLEKTKATLKDRKDGEWIIGRGWDQNKWKEKIAPHKKFLDKISTRHPIFLLRVDGHCVWCNSFAMNLSKIDSSTSNPPGGFIEKDGNGNVTGILIDNAIDLVQSKIPSPTYEQKVQWAKKAQQICFSYGITSIHDCGTDLDESPYELFRKLFHQKQITININQMTVSSNKGDLKKIFKNGARRNLFQNRLNQSCIKIFFDGAMGSHGALLFEPYSDKPDFCGLQLVDESEMLEICKKAVEKNIQVATHTIGDKAFHLVVNIYKKALQNHKNRRFRIEHCQFVNLLYLDEMKKLGIIASVQPAHYLSDSGWIEERLGRGRLRRTYLWKTLLSKGIRLAFGSDFPVESPNPFYGIKSAVTRHSPFKKNFGIREKIDIMTALKLYTTGGAFASFQENLKGKIKKGYYADFVVLSDNTIATPTDMLDKIHVLSTFLRGKVVYNKLYKLET